ncbi:hypothetical protein [Halogeometricum limi]|uniref:Uncharacterized protein n=1 Tax=Halogeometricum limi TaxID=555875 RepID=A0A1I6GTB9_9EURY|nr:hypothetical protein [Halogeometricum limi]SFR45452.1 hypothetical protein SAMN04488124_1507 [Halogeometricum limi]
MPTLFGRPVNRGRLVLSALMALGMAAVLSQTPGVSLPFVAVTASFVLVFAAGSLAGVTDTAAWRLALALCVSLFGLLSYLDGQQTLPTLLLVCVFPLTLVLVLRRRGRQSRRRR